MSQRKIEKWCQWCRREKRIYYACTSPLICWLREEMLYFNVSKKKRVFECNRINEDEYDLMFTHSEASDWSWHLGGRISNGWWLGSQVSNRLLHSLCLFIDKENITSLYSIFQKPNCKTKNKEKLRRFTTNIHG